MKIESRRIFPVLGWLAAGASLASGQGLAQGRFVPRPAQHTQFISEDGKRAVTAAEDPDIVGCRLDLEVDPPASDGAYSVKIFATNAGERTLALRKAAVLIRINAESGPKLPVALKASAVNAGQRVLVGETGGTWHEGIRTWVALASVTGEQGNSCSNAIAWRREAR